MAGTALDIFSALAQAQSSNAGSQLALGAQAEKLDAAGQQKLVAETEQATAQKLIDEQKAKADLATQQVNQNYAAAAGGNPDSATYILADLAKQSRLETMQAMDKQRQVNEIDSKSFFDNPLAWLPNQFKADSLDRESQGHLEIAKIADNSAAKINSNMISGAAAQETISNKLTAESTAAALSVAAAKAKITISDTTMKLAATNMDSINALAQGDTRALSIAQTGYNVQKSEESMALQRANALDAHESHIQNMAIGAENLKQEQFSSSIMKENQDYKAAREARDANKGELEANRLELSKLNLEYKKEELEYKKETGDPIKREAASKRLELIKQQLSSTAEKSALAQAKFAQSETKLDVYLRKSNLDIKQKEYALAAIDAEHESIKYQADTLITGLAKAGYADKAKLISDMQGEPTRIKDFITNLKSTPEGKKQYDAMFGAATDTTSYGGARLGASPGDALINTIGKLGVPTSLPKEASSTLDWLQDIATHTLAPQTDPTKPGLTAEQVSKLSDVARANMITAATQAELTKWAPNVEVAGSQFAAPPLGMFATVKDVVKTPLWQNVLQFNVANGMGKADYATVSALAIESVHNGNLKFEDAVSGLAKFYSSAVQLNNVHKDFEKFAIPAQQDYTVISKLHTGNLQLNATDEASVRKDLLLRSSFKNSTGYKLFNVTSLLGL